MAIYDASRLRGPSGGVQVTPIGAVTDGNLAARLLGYKTGTARRLFALTEEELATRLPPGGKLHVSRKIDGECAILYHGRDETLILSPTGRVVRGAAAAAAARAALIAKGVRSALVPGELHVAGDGRERAHDVPRALAEGAPPELQAALRFSAFDLMEYDAGSGAEQALPWPYERRYALLREWLGDEPAGANRPCGVVPTEIVEGAAAVRPLYDRWVSEEGGEGVVVRCDQPVAWKIKPQRTLDLAVLGYVEGRDDKSGTVRELLVGLVRPGGDFHIIGSVGTGFSDEDRRALLGTLQGLHTTSEYVETNRHYFAYQMVRPALVIEARVTDLLLEDGRGKAVQQMVLRLGEDGGWQIVRKMPLCSLVHPVFLRLRPDKEPSEHDCRLAQVTDAMVVEGADAVAAPVRLPASRVLRREVYTKGAKGGTAVRKLLVWKTNKEQLDPLYPAYVLHFTDYSPGRADALQRDVRVAASEERILAMAEELLRENIKKGWTRV